MRRVFASCALVAICLSGLAVAAAQTTPAQAGTNGPAFASGQILTTASQLPDAFAFDFWHGLIVVKAYLGEGLPDQAVVDTGLSLCLSTPDFLSKRGAQMGNPREIDILDRPVRVLDAKTQKLRVDH